MQMGVGLAHAAPLTHLPPVHVCGVVPSEEHCVAPAEQMQEPFEHTGVEPLHAVPSTH
jgi:hypothetical protein